MEEQFDDSGEYTKRGPRFPKTKAELKAMEGRDIIRLWRKSGVLKFTDWLAEIGEQLDD